MNNNMFPSSEGRPGGGRRLTRYGSAPSSVLSTAIDSIISSAAAFAPPAHEEEPEPAIALRTSNYTSPPLVRHSSLPAGFRNDNYLPAAAHDNGFSITRGIAINYNSKGIADNNDNDHGVSRLNPQLSFTHAPKEALSRISEETDNIVDHGNTSANGATRRSSHSDVTGACFTMGSWDENHHLTFSVSPTKLANTIDTNGPHDTMTMESQFQFGVPHEAALELATMDKLLNIPHDSVPCKIRAKRGFATHPRSIAERARRERIEKLYDMITQERRTRISGKLKKLQDLVPNMDKQTSYADMLDLAVQHIKTLQHEVQNLHHELDNCGCGCKKTTMS